MRILTLFFFLTTLLLARDNPFVSVSPPPLEGNETETVVSDDDAPAPKTVMKTVPRAVAQTSKETETLSFQQIRFLVSKAQIRMETKDRLKNHFAIKKPTRIILDFASNADFPTRKRGVSVAPYREIRLGSHKGYYRVVIEMDGKAAYSVAPYKYGYILTLKKN